MGWFLAGEGEERRRQLLVLGLATTARRRRNGGGSRRRGGRLDGEEDGGRLAGPRESWGREIGSDLRERASGNDEEWLGSLDLN